MTLLYEFKHFYIQAGITSSSCIPVPNLNPNEEDRVVWIKSNGMIAKFSVKIAWEEMKNSINNVDWYSFVWFTQNIPRNSFVLWMAIQRRLSTQDKLLLWNPNSCDMG